MVEVGGISESAESHGRSDFGSGKGAAVTGIRQVWQERERVGGREARTEKDRGEAGYIGMMGRRHVTPWWEDDPVRRHEQRWWRGC